MQFDYGTITLIGSGEFSDGMARVYRAILAHAPPKPHAVLLDSPAGFELGSDQIYLKAREYFERHLDLALELASCKNSRRASALEIETALRQLLHADIIFAGPGSPTYAVRQWHNSPIWSSVLNRFQHGAHLVLASAAAIATSVLALPVYEIYKAGAELYWIEGLDLFRAFGMSLIVVPHWNNNEGAHDTRFCYIGTERFQELERLLPDGATVLGIDEYTACVFDPAAESCRVMGAGVVTIRRDSQEWSCANGETFPFALLRSTTPLAAAKSAPTVVESELPELDVTTRYLTHLARALGEANEPEIKRVLIDRAHDAMHELSADWLDDSHTTATTQDLAPYVEAIIQVRKQLRQARQYALADEIRKRLTALGIELQDTDTDTTWHKITV